MRIICLRKCKFQLKLFPFQGTEEREEGNEEEPEGSGGTDEGEGATQVMMDAVPLPVQASDYLGPTEFVSGIDDALPTTVTAIVDVLTAYMH